MKKQLISFLLAVVMVLGMIPNAVFARTSGKDGSAEMNEDYAAKETLMPIGPSFSTYTLLEWIPETDPDAPYSRASIPLEERVGGFVVNPLANPEAKLMLCSTAAIFDHDHTSAQGADSFLSYAFNYWQYVDSFVYWSCSHEGLIVVPTGEFIDAAHTNGVPVLAMLNFPWGSGPDYVQEVSDFCQKAADGSFPVADKMIEVMDYYGFDGYFFNQESYGCSVEIAKRLDEMIHYMHAKQPDMLISWYDSMTKDGHVSYVNGVSDSNKHWMAYDENGVVGVDGFFMNYNWSSGTIATTIASMKSIGRSQFDAFAGIHVEQNCMDTYFADHLLVDENGRAKLSLALYAPNSTLGLASDGAQFHEVERTFYTNGKEDPRDTSVELSSSAWAGMSRLLADKTPITSAPFVTDFNSGHGTGYFVDGVLSRDGEWSYQSNQDVMPTWTWIIDSTGDKLEGDYDFTDAYNGGSSIKFHGKLNGRNDILLYSTDIPVENKMSLSLTARGGLENASLVAYLDNGTASSYAGCDQVIVALANGEGWVETKIDLSACAGKTLKAIGLKIEGNVADYQINLGRIAVLDKTRAALTGPASIVLDEIMYTDAYTAEARIRWNKVTGATSYEIYKVHGETKTLIMETPSTAFYIPTLKRLADEADVTIEIVPINRNGVRGKGTQLVIDWLYGNDDSDEVVVHTLENVALNATVTGVSFEDAGAPASNALDGTSANNSKWCATNKSSGWLSIDIGREVTVRRWRVEHGEYGGEANDTNTIDFALEYKDPASNNWVQVKRIRNNHAAVTDVLLGPPVTAREWRLYVYDDGTSPWSGIRIYEWQMFESDQFPQTDVVPMQFASAVNAVGANDTFTLKNVPAGVSVNVYNAAGEKLGEQVACESAVVISGLDFGAEAGRVYYTTTGSAAAESAKLSAPFEAENAEKSAVAEDVSFAPYYHPGSVTSSIGGDIYTTLTVNGLNYGDVVYVYENGEHAEYTKASLPVAEGETSVSINRVLVPIDGGTLNLQVKRTGCLISDVYAVPTPYFDDAPEPTEPTDPTDPPEQPHTHSYTAVVTAPTCVEQGFTTYTCDCGYSYDTNFIPPLGHDMGQWEVTEAPTCTEKGSESSRCSRCDYTETRIIEATGHHYITAVVTNPTCTEKGFTTHTCTCGDSYADQYVDALGHHYAEGLCTRCGEDDPDYQKPVENPFTDVSADQFYYTPVMWAVANGITNGATPTSFNPDGTCMRAHVVTFLHRAVGNPAPTSTRNPFSDVKAGDFFYQPVLWAIEKGITNGVSANNFGAYADCNRAAVVTFLWRAAGSPEPEFTYNPFVDVKVTDFFYKPVLWAMENGITKGIDTTHFGPAMNCNRAQVVTFLYRTYN